MVSAGRVWGALIDSLARVVVRRRGTVIVLWLLIAGALNVLVPQLEQVIGQSTSTMVPGDEPSVQALSAMDRSFGGSGAKSIVVVVLSDDGGLSAADQQYYAGLVQRLRDQKQQVASVQDTIAAPGLKEALTSLDGKAEYIPVGLWGNNGAPQTTAQIDQLRTLTRGQTPPGLQVHITGPMATVADMQTEMINSMLGITIVTIVLITGILLAIYRSLATAMVALTTVGISLATSRAVTALCGLGLFSVSTFTASFLTAVVFGACTDYCVFLISRFHEFQRAGQPPEMAVAAAIKRVAGVVLSSGATVIVAASGMSLARVSFFSTTGPSIAVGVVITLAAAFTLGPALLAFVATRGYAGPGRVRGTSRWKSTSEYIVRRPGRVLLVGLVTLGILAAFYPGGQQSYDTRTVQPASTDSNLGDAQLAKHFLPNEVYPDYILVNSNHDMRDPTDLAALESAASEVSKVDDVAMVRAVTRPLGTPITEASIGYQVGQVGDSLAQAGSQLADGQNGTQQLTNGAQQLSDNTGHLAQGAVQLADGSSGLSEGVKSAIDGANQLLNGARSTQAGLGQSVNGANQARDGGQRLSDASVTLAAGLDLARDQTNTAVNGLGAAANALRTDTVCTLDPICSQALRGVDQVLAGERDQLLPGLTKAASAAHAIAGGDRDLSNALTDLRDGLATAKAGTDRLADGQRLLAARLGNLSAGAEETARAARAIAEGAGASSNGATRLRDGTVVATKSVNDLQAGLTSAADFLRTVGSQAKDPAIGGFYLPSTALQDPRLALASGMFLSSDGRTARLMVLHRSDPQGAVAMQSTAEISNTAVRALRGTTLDGSQVGMTGTAPIYDGLRRAIDTDFATFALFALLAVLVILVVLLRSIFAPLYLLASVILSFAAAMGISVLVWQHLLGIDLNWSVGPVAFVLLVAVGADYNMLLITRIREESLDRAGNGVARATTLTGPVITAAGVIFAASMFAMLAGSVTILAQIGFTIGIGLLLDTFIVRTLLVPATVQLLGRWNWWPSRPANTSHSGRSRAEESSISEGIADNAPALR